MASRGSDALKRGIDIVGSTAGLVLTAPVQAALALMIRRRLGSPVIFRQRRPGKDDEIFELMKFRTMLEPDPERGLVSDADRITPFGSFLRSTSLDELPTLVNVLKGDMSLVGPRPLLMSYLQLYTPEQARRHEVRPGITGLAQVSGRNALSWEDKFRLDVEYVDQRSLRLDVQILLKTLLKVIRRDGITDADGVSMSPFEGTQTTEPHPITPAPEPGSRKDISA